jgi:copper transport protein
MFVTIVLIFPLIPVQTGFASTDMESSSAVGQNLNITQYTPPSNVRLSPFLIFDNQRNSLWMGDITNGSGKLIQFDLTSKKFTEHEIPGIDIATHMALDSNGTIWYTDSFKYYLGQYNPKDGSNKIYPLPDQYAVTGITVDSSDNVWIGMVNSDNLLEFNTHQDKFSAIALSFYPLSITFDKATSMVWVAELTGTIASIDPSKNTVTEYSQNKMTFGVPTCITTDPKSDKIYYSEHNSYAVSVFDPISKTFMRYPIDFGGFPSGMVLRNDGSLWVSQHTLNKIAVIDTNTGNIKLVELPEGALVQWLEQDSNGNVLFVNQSTNQLGEVTAPYKVPEFSQVIGPILAFSMLIAIIGQIVVRILTKPLTCSKSYFGHSQLSKYFIQ